MNRARNADSPDAVPAGKGERLVSLDATRGLALLALIAGGMALQRPSFLFDLLPTTFLLCAGMAQVYSRAQRQGQAWPAQAGHALLRLGLLLALGVYLDSYAAGQLVLEPRGNLQLLAFASFLAFLVLPVGIRGQALLAGFLLVGHLGAVLIHDKAAGHDGWSAGAAFDQWLGLAPHPRQRVMLTLLPVTAVVLIGSLLGALVRGPASPGRKLATLLIAGSVCLIVGAIVAGSDGPFGLPWAPLIPPLTAQWPLTRVGMAVGGAILVFTLFFALAEGLQWRPCCMPLALVGRCSLALYLAFALFHDWALRSVNLVLPDSRPWIAAYKPILSPLLLLALFWLLGFWLSRRQNAARA